MTALDTKALLVGVSREPWKAKSAVSIVAPKRHDRADGSSIEYMGDIAWTRPISRQEGGAATREANARLIASAPRLAREHAALCSALERLHRNFGLLLAGKPVRDVAETDAEVRAALNGEGDE